MSEFKLKQRVKVQWPEWRESDLGTIVDSFPANYETFYVVELDSGEKYTYKEHELKAHKEDESETIGD